MSWHPQHLLHNAKIALAFSDPAGANACLAIAKMQQMEGKEVPEVFTNRQPQPPFELDFPITLTSSVPYFNRMGIEVLFTGTSHPDSSDSFECNCILNAKKEGIYIISFIDHWTNFRLRFSALPEDTYPDEIWVVDDAAKALAINEGLPAVNIRVMGNPYHFFLTNYWRSHFSKGAFLTTLGIVRVSPVVLYAPDPISLRPGSNLAGFSESEVLTDILQLLKTLPVQALLIIKLHPLQPEEGIEKIVSDSGYNNCVILKNVNVPELIQESDLVIGFYSNMLLEAKALGKKVIRYFPGNSNYDLLKHSSTLTAIGTKNELKALLQQLISPHEQ